MGALTPLGKVANGRRNWFSSVTAYTVSGAVSSAAVGALLGGFGSLVLPRPFWLPCLIVAVGVALLGALREIRLVSFPLPQPARQTRDTWAKHFRSPASAALWGFDLGLTVTTRFTFAGVWFLIALAVLSTDALFGAGAFLAYWLGRAGSVWIAPAFIDSPRATPHLLDRIDSSRRVWELTHAAGLLSAALILVLLVREPY